MLSLIVPVYRNEASIPDLVDELARISTALVGKFEAVLVVDGSPDRSLELLTEALPRAPFRSQLVALSRNFGSFAAIAAGLARARGDTLAVMTADLQEPPELILELEAMLRSGSYDVVVGVRSRRHDTLLTKVTSSLFWSLYRALVQREVPSGGVDVFGCTAGFRDHLVALGERNTSLVGLVFWLGFRRGEARYERRPRRHGASAWTLGRRFRYLLDSTFAFSDLPVRLLSLAGVAGMGMALLLGLVVLLARLTGAISVPGYSATVLTVMFFGGLNSLGLGIIGEYVWRAFENTKGRPPYVVARQQTFEPEVPR